MSDATKVPPPDFGDWLRDKLGTRQWVVSRNGLRAGLRHRGYDRAVSPREYGALEAEYENQYGKRFRKALRDMHRELGDWGDRRILAEGATVADLRRALAVLIIKSESNPNAFSMSVEEATRLHNAERGENAYTPSPAERARAEKAEAAFNMPIEGSPRK